MNENKIKIIIIIGVFLTIIIVTSLTIFLNEKQKIKTKNQTEIENEELIDNSEEEAETQFEENYDLLQMFLDVYNLRANGSEMLYTENDEYINGCQWLYLDKEEKEKKFKKSESDILVEENRYVAYETDIDYEIYKEELLKIMSEEVFEKYFTEYAKAVNGKLYITNEQIQNFTIKSLEKLEDNHYNLTYRQNDEERETIVVIDEENSKIMQINL